MNIGLTLIGALLFLAPGLAIFLVFALDKPPFVRRPLLSSGSLPILGIVPPASAFVHGCFMVAAMINGAIATKARVIPWPVDPNPYPALLQLVAGKSAEPGDLAWGLIAIAVITSLTALICILVLRLMRGCMASKYGPGERWPDEDTLEFLYRQSVADQSRAIIATVWTRKPLSNKTGGWVGIIEKVRVDHLGDIVSVSLSKPTTFDVDRWSANLNTPIEAYREHDWEGQYQVVTIPGDEISAVSYFITDPPSEVATYT